MKKNLRKILNFGHKIWRHLELSLLELGFKEFLAIMHSFAHWELISFYKVEISTPSNERISPTTRYEISKLKFTESLDPKVSVYLSIFKVLSSNISLCKSLNSIMIIQNYSIDSSAYYLQSQIRSLGFTNVRVSIEMKSR